MIKFKNLLSHCKRYIMSNKKRGGLTIIEIVIIILVGVLIIVSITDNGSWITSFGKKITDLFDSLLAKISGTI